MEGPPYQNPVTWQSGGLPVTVSTAPLEGETPARTQERHDEAVEFMLTHYPEDPS